MCCSADQACFNGACCNKKTCSDLASFVECGDSGVSDGCGGTVECGDCGGNGTCVSNHCDCNDNYGVISGEHECRHACDGYLPFAGCCDEEWTVYCAGSLLEAVNCADFSAPFNFCGWDAANVYFTCNSGVIPPPAVTDVCPSNIVIDKTPPACTDDIYEVNNTWNVNATPVLNGTDLFATKCSGDEDYYSINLQDGDSLTVTIDFDHALLDLDLVLWYQSVDKTTWHYVDWYMNSNASNNMETFTFVAGSEMPWFADEFTGAGTYFVEVIEFGSTSTGYQMTVEVP